MRNSTHANQTLRILALLTPVIASMILLTGIVSAASVTTTIVDDATGRNCTLVGVWNAATKTCTLTMDFLGEVVIGSEA